MAHIFQEILEWSKELTPWQNEGIRQLFQNGSLSQAQKDKIFEMAKIENGLAPKPAEAIDLMLKASELPAPPNDGAKIYLKGVRELTNVNSLKNDQRLSIGRQVTSIFGNNGAGKSGYARVTKRACRARAVDPVLPNVYATGPALVPSAIFEIEEEGKTRDEKWTEGGASPVCLGRFAVFDSRCGRVYVSENNELAFLPYGFDIIKGVASLTDEVKKRFQELGKFPDSAFLKPFLDNTKVGTQLAALSAETNESTIQSLGEWTVGHAKELDEKETESANYKTKSPQTIREALTAEKSHLQTVITAVSNALSAISDEKLETIKQKAAELEKCEQAVAAAAQLAFGEINMPGIGGEAWRELVLSASKFSAQDAYPAQPFPASSADAQCVLCLRPLDEGSRNRLQGFWNFIQDDASAKKVAAKAGFDTEITWLKNVPTEIPKEVAVLEDAFKAAKSQVYGLLQPFYADLNSRAKSIEEAIATKDWGKVKPLPESPLEQCNSEIPVINEKLKVSQDDAKIGERIQILTKDINELKARQKLNVHLESILKYLADFRAASLASRAAGKITTNSISIKSAELQNKFVTEAFIKAVNDELAAFGLPRQKPRLDKKSDKGKVLLRLTVQTAKNVLPESVFSEGERTAISLACFLAELAIGKDNCGIILDDPVSSLDHRVREKIVNRLVAEAANRQIIVFTHDLVFHRELKAACERQKVHHHFQCIESLGGVTGIINDAPPWIAMDVGQRTSVLEKLLSDLRKLEVASDLNEYRNTFRSFYGALRSTWERGVEEVLFNQVVQRLEKEVKTLRLDGVFVDAESVRSVFDGMTRASKMIDAHDHAVAENSAFPDTNDVANDLASFKDFIAKQGEKRKEAMKQNAHLKK